MECNSDDWHLPVENNNKNGCGEDRIDSLPPVSYTHLTLPTNREV